MSEWDQCPWFLILSHCLPRLNHLGTSSGWQVINHCSHATFPEALWTKPYDNPKIGSLKTWSSPMWAWGLLLPLYQAFQWKCLTGPPLDSFWMPLAPCLPSLSLSEESRFRLFPRTRPPPPAWRVHSQAGGKGPRFERAGAFKKVLSLSCADLECWLKNGAVVWGRALGREGVGPSLFVNDSDLLMNWSLVQCNLSWVVVQGKGLFFPCSFFQVVAVGL